MPLMSVSPQVAVMPAVTAVPWLETACRFPDSINGSFANWSGEMTWREAGVTCHEAHTKRLRSSCPWSLPRARGKSGPQETWVPGLALLRWTCGLQPATLYLNLFFKMSRLSSSRLTNSFSQLERLRFLSLRSCQNGFVLGEDKLPSSFFSSSMHSLTSSLSTHD